MVVLKKVISEIELYTSGLFAKIIFQDSKGFKFVFFLIKSEIIGYLLMEFF